MSGSITSKTAPVATDSVTALLRAVYDALNLPLPDITAKDEQEYRLLLAIRATDVRVILAGVLEQDHDIARASEHLSRWIAEAPVTYAPWEDERGAR